MTSFQNQSRGQAEASTGPERRQALIERADRILDAAGSLLLRLGYRKLTIEDIARQAEVGKGTVYLHWRAKEQLGQALLMRESIELKEELLLRIRDDPAEMLPHRFVRTSFVATLRRPLMLAMLADDAEVVGTLRRGPVGEAQERINQRFFELMIGNRLLRDDVPHLAYTLRAALSGFYLLENLEPGGMGLDLEAKADAIAFTVKHAFERGESPDSARLAAVAAEFIALLEDNISQYRAWIYEGGRT